MLFRIVMTSWPAMITIFTCCVRPSLRLSPFFSISQNKINKTCVINDPLGQTHSPTSSDHFFNRRLFCFIWKSGEGRTDQNMCENNDHYRPGLWVSCSCRNDNSNSKD